MELVGQKIATVIVFCPRRDLREYCEILVAQLNESAIEGQDVFLESQCISDVRLGCAFPRHPGLRRGVTSSRNCLDVLGPIRTLQRYAEQGCRSILESVQLAIANRRAGRIETDIIVVFPESG